MCVASSCVFPLFLPLVFQGQRTLGEGGGMERSSCLPRLLCCRPMERTLKSRILLQVRNILYSVGLLTALRHNGTLYTYTLMNPSPCRLWTLVFTTLTQLKWFVPVWVVVSTVKSRLFLASVLLWMPKEEV